MIAARVWRATDAAAITPSEIAGSVMVFALAASAFATPAIIGGRRLKVIATAAYDEFLNTLNWPLGAALSVLLMLVIGVLVILALRRFDLDRFLGRR